MKDIKEKSETIRLFRWLFSKETNGLLRINKWLIFPLSAVYMVGNFMTLLCYFTETGNNDLYYRLLDYLIEKHGRNNGYDIFFSWEYISMWYFADRHLNQIYAVIIILLISADIIFSWQPLKTCLVKQKSDRCGSCKESPRRRADALQEDLTPQMPCMADFCQKRFLEVAGISKERKPIVKWIFYGIIMVIILFIAFVATPVFYEFEMDIITSV